MHGKDMSVACMIGIVMLGVVMTLDGRVEGKVDLWEARLGFIMLWSQYVA